MNLKEAFRYQNHLEALFAGAVASIVTPTHALSVSKKHLRHAVNPDAEDFEETVERGEFYKNDDVLRFLRFLISEREKLCRAIFAAKTSLLKTNGFDLDAAVETNKFRQKAASKIRSMLGFIASKKVELGQDYKFNVEGNQAPYRYDVEVTISEDYDRAAAKELLRLLLERSDKTSAAIDQALINTAVEYIPLFGVNATFEDAMEDFLSGDPA